VFCIILPQPIANLLRSDTRRKALRLVDSILAASRVSGYGLKTYQNGIKIISTNSSNGTGIANDLVSCPNRFGMARSWPVEPLMPIGGMVALPLAISAFQRVVGTSEAPLFISCL